MAPVLVHLLTLLVEHVLKVLDAYLTKMPRYCLTSRHDADRHKVRYFLGYYMNEMGTTLKFIKLS